MPEQFANNASTVVATAIGAADQTIAVNSTATPMPTSPSFRIKIDTEYLLVTAVNPGPPTAAPTLAAVAGATSYTAGSFTVGYTYVMNVGETVLGPTAVVTVAAGQAIQVSAINNIPSYVTSLKFYFTSVPAGSTAGFVASATPASGTVAQFNLTTQGNSTAAPVSSPTNTYGVTRGTEGSTVTTHTVSTPVIHILTAGSLTTAFARIDQSNTEVSATDYKVTGLTGALSTTSRWVGTTTGNAAPVTGTWLTGDTVIDTAGTLWVRDPGGFWRPVGTAGPYFMRVRQTATQAIASGGGLVITYDTVDEDPASRWSGNPNYRWSIPVTGRYDIRFNVKIQPPTTNAGVFIRLWVNGANARHFGDLPALTSSYTGYSGSTRMNFNANDTIALLIGSGSITVNTAVDSVTCNWLEIHYAGPT